MQKGKQKKETAAQGMLCVYLRELCIKKRKRLNAELWGTPG